MAITFKEMKQYISRIVRVSICFENGSYDNYTLISDIPEGKYEDLYVYGIGMIDVEFPLDVYSKPDSKQQMSEKCADWFLGCGLEIVLYDKPRTDIVRNCEKGLRFGDLRDCLQIGGNFSIVLREDWSSEEYEWRRDIPEKYDKMFVYGIGIEVNPKEADRFKDLFKDLDTVFARRMVIVLSETLRQDIDVNDTMEGMWKNVIRAGNHRSIKKAFQ